MKKVICLILCVVLTVLCFAGCNASDAPETTAQETEDSTREALCPICNVTVSWMGLTQAYVDTIVVVDSKGELIDSAIMSGEVFPTRHYYLAEDLTYNDSPVMGFFRGPESGLVSCLDLNDHNITTTATTSIFGNGGVLNVFGNGVVTGYSPNAQEGAAVRQGNRNPVNALNLYGGTYKKTENTSPENPVVAFNSAGRSVSVYEGVVIDGGDGVAVFADSSENRQREGSLLLQGCTVKGDVRLAPFSGFATYADFIDCTIDGEVTVPTGHELTLKGKVEIEKLTLGAEVKLTADALSEGTAVNVDASGVFTQTTDQAEAYLTYFTPADTSKTISVQDGALSCK